MSQEYQLEVRSPYNIISNCSTSDKLNKFEVKVKNHENVLDLQEKIKSLLSEEYNPNSIRFIYLGKVLNKEEKFGNLFEKLTNLSTPIVFHLVVGYKTQKTSNSSQNSTNLNNSSTSHTTSVSQQPPVSTSSFTNFETLQNQNSSQDPNNETQPPTNNDDDHPTDYLYFNIVKYQGEHYLSPIRSNLSTIDGVQGIFSPLNIQTQSTASEDQNNTENAPPIQRVRELIREIIRQRLNPNNRQNIGERLFMGFWSLIQSFFISTILTSAFHIEDDLIANLVSLSIFALLLGLRMNAFNGYFNTGSAYIRNYLPDLSEAPSSLMGAIFRFIYLFFATLIPERAPAGNNNDGFDGF